MYRAISIISSIFIFTQFIECHREFPNDKEGTLVCYMPLESGNKWEYNTKYTSNIQWTEKSSKGIEVWKILKFNQQTLKGTMDCSFEGTYYEVDHDTHDTTNVSPASNKMTYPIRIENNALIVGDYPPNMDSHHILEQFPTITSDQTVIICFPLDSSDTIERYYNNGGPRGYRYTIDKNVGFKYFQGWNSMEFGSWSITLNLREFKPHDR